MTLSVSLFFRDPVTQEVSRVEDPVESPEQFGDPALGGFESWRKHLWGSRWAIEHGAIYLPQLAHADLYVEHGELLKFRNECQFIFERCNELSAATGGVATAGAIRARVANYINAINQAQKREAGVLIC